MNAAEAPDAVGRRGRIDKRQAILDAAFTVFAREGYAQAGVDVIAAEAGVAKATVYNHFGDKETLLRQMVALLAEQALAQNLAAVERLIDPGDDLRALLEDVGLSLAHCYCDERSWTLRRLLLAELGRFPDLLDVIWGQVNDRVTEALADRLARLTLAGHLSMTDPVAAAEQFAALLGAPLDKRTRLGTREVPEEEIRAVVSSAAGTFLSAFAAT
jgi:AcrR family transcriptional regulator